MKSLDRGWNEETHMLLWFVVKLSLHVSGLIVIQGFCFIDSICNYESMDDLMNRTRYETVNDTEGICTSTTAGSTEVCW